MSRNLIYLCLCTHLVRLPNQPDKFICQPCIQRQNLFQTDGSGDFGESSHLGVSGDWYSMVFYSPELHWYHKSDPEWNITIEIYKYLYLEWEKYSWTEGTKILTHSSQLKIVHDGGKYPKGPGSLEGLVKLWKISRVLVLPGLQMDSKADHDPHANWDWWKYVFYAMTLASYGLK